MSDQVYRRKYRKKQNNIGTQMSQEVIDGFRLRQGMKRVDVKMRNCLKCEGEFKSEAKNHRMCANCSKLGENLPSYALVPSF